MFGVLLMAAITITANNVTLDLNGWKVGGQAAGTGTQATGIASTANNVTIENGIVRGFYVGIVLGGRGVVVQDMLVDQNTKFGIEVDGPDAVIKRNQVVQTGGSTASTDVDAIGIAAYGPGSSVSNNVVSGLTATGTGSEVGIDLSRTSAANSLVRNNFVSNTAIPTGGAPSVGIYQTQSIAVNNTVSNFYYGITSNGGIYAYNTANNCTSSYSGAGGAIAGAGNSP